MRAVLAVCLCLSLASPLALPGAAPVALAAERFAGLAVERGQRPLPAPPAIAMPPEALADSRPATGGRGVVKALLIAPTDRYRHAVLGDGIEAGGLRVITEGGLMMEVRLPADAVFEDLRPRLVDLTGDGRDEVLAVKAYRDRGAALALYEARDGALVQIGETPAIGKPNRWRNPAGTGDFDGDGRMDLVEVTTPHIGGTLRLWQWRDGRLHAGATYGGVSNHAIGSRALDLSAVLDLDGDGDDELLIPADGRRTLLALDLKAQGWQLRDRLDLRAAVDGDFAVSRTEADALVAEIGIPLADGTTLRLTR